MAEILTAEEILSRLVGFPTVSRGSNLDLVDWLEAYLRGHGIETLRPFEPTILSQVSETPASTETRAFTAAGRTLSWYAAGCS